MPRTARAKRRITSIIAWTSCALVAVLVVTVAAVAVTYNEADAGIHRSGLQAPTVPQNTGETNILIMGLDSRLDENGQPLSEAEYEALHAEDQSVGGYNANVLMLIHIPAGGGRAVGISIPRDDWVPLAGSPDGQSMGKIKEAYGLALDQSLRALSKENNGETDAQKYQQARADARQAEVDTVSQFLGVPIDHFVEVTMAAFYQLAQAVQPIQVCLNENTTDAYSGAQFHQGYQELSASQAVAFVRQRRDTSGSGVNLTDLDRERRQQAFIISLGVKLAHENVFADLGMMNSLIHTASQNIALDSGFNLLSFAQDAQHFAGGGITFQTLPIQGFGVKNGQDVIIVDTARIQTMVKDLIAQSDASSQTPGPTPTGSSAPGATPAPAAGGSGSTPNPSDVYKSPMGPMTSGAVPCVN